MEAEALRKLWDDAGGGGDPAPKGAGLLGLHVVDDPAALAGMALAVLGLPLDDVAGRPAAVRRASLRYADWLPGARPPASGRPTTATSRSSRKTRPSPSCSRTSRLADIVAAGAAPLVLGGDALVSVPVLQVLSGKLRGRLGVVAFTPSYDVSPEPLYAAGSRWARALELDVLAPANLVLVGGRAAPPDGPARRVLDALGATTFSLEDVLRDGMATVAQEALETAASGTEAVYLSVDLGVLAGIGDPVGLQARELAAGVAVVSGALLAAADICGAGSGMGRRRRPVRRRARRRRDRRRGGRQAQVEPTYRRRAVRSARGGARPTVRKEDQWTRTARRRPRSSTRSTSGTRSRRSSSGASTRTRSCRRGTSSCRRWCTTGRSGSSSSSTAARRGRSRC